MTDVENEADAAMGERGAQEELADETLQSEDAVNEEAIVEGQELGSDAFVDTEEETEKVKKNLFKKKEKKDKKDEAIEELTDKVKRQMAEFDNFRKRTEKEKSAMYEIGAKSVVEKILPVVDNFERGLGTIAEGDKSTPFAEGMNMIYKQLIAGLEEVGVKAIDAVGTEFNPDLHNAVMHIDDESYGENEVTEELQKGYMYRESVVRHSMVKVAN